MNKILKLINSGLSPLIGMGSLTERGYGSRSVVFAIEKLSRGIYLGVTCAHSFYVFEDYKSITTKAFVQTISSQTKEVFVLNRFLFEEEDVAFVVIESSYELPLITLIPAPDLVAGKFLSLFKNDLRPMRGFTRFISIKRQLCASRRKAFHLHTISDECLDVDYSLDPSAKEGAYPCLEYSISSWEGCSGSPLLDDDLNLHGVIIGAPVVNGETNDVGRCICVPTQRLIVLRQALSL